MSGKQILIRIPEDNPIESLEEFRNAFQEMVELFEMEKKTLMKSAMAKFGKEETIRKLEKINNLVKAMEKRNPGRPWHKQKETAENEQ